MLRKIGYKVNIGASVTPFKSVGKSPAIKKAASDFDNANLNVKKIKTYQSQNLQCRHSSIYSWNFGPGPSGND